MRTDSEPSEERCNAKVVVPRRFVGRFGLAALVHCSHTLCFCLFVCSVVATDGSVVRAGLLGVSRTWPSKFLRFKKNNSGADGLYGALGL